MNLISNLSKSTMSGIGVAVVDYLFTKLSGGTPSNPIPSVISDPPVAHAVFNGAVQTGTRAFVSEAVQPMIAGNSVGRALNSAKITDHVVSGAIAYGAHSFTGSPSPLAEGAQMFIESAFGDSVVDMFDSFAGM